MPQCSLRYRIVNVFAEEADLSGDALAVIEDARDLSDGDVHSVISANSASAP
jgi:predicted PhzF superfamily epimerase YddE/YHI9